MGEESGEGVESAGDGAAFGGRRLLEGFEERVQGELRHAGGEKLADWTGGDEEGDAAIGGVFFAVDEALFDQAIGDSGDGAVGKADCVTELFETEALGADNFGHDEALRAGEVAAGELGLKTLTHAALNDVELALGVLREGAEFG